MTDVQNASIPEGSAGPGSITTQGCTTFQCLDKSNGHSDSERGKSRADNFRSHNSRCLVFFDERKPIAHFLDILALLLPCESLENFEIGGLNENIGDEVEGRIVK